MSIKKFKKNKNKKDLLISYVEKQKCPLPVLLREELRCYMSKFLLNVKSHFIFYPILGVVSHLELNSLSLQRTQ